MRHFCLQRYKTRYTPAKRDRIKYPSHCQHPERDQNVIGTRYEFAQFEAMKGQDRVAFHHTLGFVLIAATGIMKHLKNERHARLKNEIGMTLGNKFPPTLI